MEEHNILTYNIVTRWRLSCPIVQQKTWQLTKGVSIIIEKLQRLAGVVEFAD